MPHIAKVFQSGNSQAVRLPKEFRFDVEEVEVSREGDAPIEFIYRDAIDSTTFASGKTDFASFVPSVFNAERR